MAYDLLILGGGPAGYIAAERAGHSGLNVLVIEKRSVGGVCLNEGCIPSKALLYSAKMLDNAKNGEKYGVNCENPALDHAKVIARKNKVVRTLVTGVKASLKANHAEAIEGEGVIKGRSSDGFEVKVADKNYSGKNLLIATGSVPIFPQIPGLKEGLTDGFVLTNREILDIPEIPETLTVIGGGIIGLEMASYFSSAGSRVTVIEMLDHIAGNMDGEISAFLFNSLKKKGIEFHLCSRVVEIKKDSVIIEADGKKEEIRASKALLSIGRKPFIEGIGLESIGVLIEKGRIVTDEQGRTNMPGVYAAGDVNGVSMLAHTAYREGEVCVNTILGKKDRMRYNAIPSVIYTNPEAAGVGETVESAKAKGLDFETAKVSMRYSGRFIAENEGGDGICKVLIDKSTRKLIGVQMIGNYSSEIIYGAALMIETEMRVDDIKELVFPHPTVSEIIREAIFSV